MQLVDAQLKNGVIVKAMPWERKAIQHPGSRGGRYYLTDEGHVRYGHRPFTTERVRFHHDDSGPGQAGGKTEEEQLIKRVTDTLKSKGIQVRPGRTARGNACLDFSGNTYAHLNIFRALKGQARGIWFDNGAWHAFPDRYRDVIEGFGGHHVDIRSRSTGPEPGPIESSARSSGEIAAIGSGHGGGTDAGGVQPGSAQGESGVVPPRQAPTPTGTAASRPSGDGGEGVSAGSGQPSDWARRVFALSVDELARVEPPTPISELRADVAA